MSSMGSCYPQVLQFSITVKSFSQVSPDITNNLLPFQSDKQRAGIQSTLWVMGPLQVCTRTRVGRAPNRVGQATLQDRRHVA